MMRPGRHRPRQSRTRIGTIAAALALACAAPVRADDGLADRFSAVLAPDTEVAANQQLLFDIIVNGVDQGVMKVERTGGRVVLPKATLAALRLPGDRLDLAATPDIHYSVEETTSVLRLTVPVALLGRQTLAVQERSDVLLSPEVWGGWINYNVNVRKDLATGSGSSPDANAVAWGGEADLNLTGPDLVGGSGWAYDSQQNQAPVRLDSSLTWRPAARDIAVTLGDAVSDVSSVMAAARPYRFAGITAGTDHSAEPAWSPTPIPSVSGTAQAQSAIDVVISGERALHTDTSGGPFTVTLPQGAFGTAASVVVTDVTGQTQIIALQAPRVDAQTVSGGTFLWSAAIGTPQFNYASPFSSYLPTPYGYASGRYGINDRLTAIAHAEAGPGLAESEVGIGTVPLPWLAIRTLAAASHSQLGTGLSGGFGLAVAGPWGLGLDVTDTANTTTFDDVVSASGRLYDKASGVSWGQARPLRTQQTIRLSWQVAAKLQIAGSSQQTVSQCCGQVSFQSVSLNWSVRDIPFFFNVSRSEAGGQRDLAAVFGVSVSFGATQASVTGGAATGSPFTGGIQASHGLQREVGDIGWSVNTQRTPVGDYLNAATDLRTGYGIPGVTVISLGSTRTAYATVNGSAGLVDRHPFIADPVNGGVAVVDGGAPNLPVLLNQDAKGSTGADGKLAIPLDVVSTPQRVMLDTAGLPMNMLAGATQQQVTIRSGGAATASFEARMASSSAIVTVTVDGKAPPNGSTLVGVADSAPIDSHGRAYIEQIKRGEVLMVEFADGGSCKVATGFDGKGGVGRHIGPFECR
jgi:outer membrane usher protein